MEQAKSKPAKLTGVCRNASHQTGCQSKKLTVQLIAYGQMATSAISLLLTVGMIVYGISYTVVVAEDPELDFEEEFDDLDPIFQNLAGVISILWFGIIVFAVDTLFQLWASIRLLKATENAISGSDALKCIRFWWNCTIISTFAESTPLLFSKYYWFGLLYIIIRLSLLFHVWGFRKTVEKKINAARAALKEDWTPCAIKIVIPPQ